MVWLLLVMLSCITKHDFSYKLYPIDKKMEVFVIGQPQKNYSWTIEPNVRICNSTEISVFRVNQALRYWEKLGYKFGSVYTDSSPLCMNARFGEIVITLPEAGFGSGQIASTKIYTHVKTNDIVKAKIFMLPKNARKERVLEHEIGHALGWRHYNQKFHMMHSNWFLGGYDSKGLSNN
tara:strand:- start:536 stop:1069 length:534 start_codon:yes stop_codon:yes gene_type:complete